HSRGNHLYSRSNRSHPRSKYLDSRENFAHMSTSATNHSEESTSTIKNLKKVKNELSQLVFKKFLYIHYFRFLAYIICFVHLQCQDGTGYLLQHVFSSHFSLLS